MSELIPLTGEEKEEFELLSKALSDTIKNGTVFSNQQYINTNLNEEMINQLREGNSILDVLKSIDNNTELNNEELKIINETLVEELRVCKEINQNQAEQLEVISKLLSVNNDHCEISNDIYKYLVSEHGKGFFKDKAGDAVVNLVVSAVAAILRSKGCLI